MDIQKFVTTKEDGSWEIDKEGFQSAFDAEISRAVEKFKNGKGKEEIRQQLEQEAKLSAEEKLKQEREEFEAYKLQAKIELNKEKAKAKMEGKGFSDDELEILLSTINEDSEKSLETVDKLIKAREAVLEQTKQSAIQGLQQSQQNAGKVLIKPDGSKSEDVKPVGWTQTEILGNYRNQAQKSQI